MRKKWLDFGDLDLFFKVTPALWISNFDQKSLSAPYLLNQMMNSSETMYCNIGIIKIIGLILATLT